MNARRRDKRWFLIPSSIRGWGWERKVVTVVCEALNADEAMTAALTEQWNISVLIPLDLYSRRHPFQRIAELCACCAFAMSNWLEINDIKTTYPPLRAHVFWFLLPLRWLLTYLPGRRVISSLPHWSLRWWICERHAAQLYLRQLWHILTRKHR